MDNKETDALYNFMQTIIDTLKSIYKKLSALSKVDHSKQFTEIKAGLGGIIKEMQNQSNHETIPSVIPKPTIIEKHNHYIIFGKDSPITTKWFFGLIACVIIIWFSFKYISPVIAETNTRKSQLADYDLFYKYLLLKDHQNSALDIPIRATYNKVITKDSNLLKEFKILDAIYSKKVLKKKLENQLKNLK